MSQISCAAQPAVTHSHVLHLRAYELRIQALPRRDKCHFLRDGAGARVVHLGDHLQVKGRQLMRRVTLA